MGPSALTLKTGSVVVLEGLDKAGKSTQPARMKAVIDGGDAPEQRDLDADRRRLVADHLDRATAIPGLPQQVLFDEVLHVLVNRRHGREAEPPADLFEARRVPLPLQVFADEIEDLFLSLGEVHSNLHGPGTGALAPTLPCESPRR